MFVLFFANSKCPALCRLQMLQFFFVVRSSFAFAVNVISSVDLIVALRRGVKRCRLLPRKECSKTRRLCVCLFFYRQQKAYHLRPIACFSLPKTWVIYRVWDQNVKFYFDFSLIFLIDKESRQSWCLPYKSNVMRIFSNLFTLAIYVFKRNRLFNPGSLLMQAVPVFRDRSLENKLRKHAKHMAHSNTTVVLSCFFEG